MNRFVKSMVLALVVVLSFSTVFAGCSSPASTAGVTTPAVSASAQATTGSETTTPQTTQSLQPYEIIFAFPGDQYKDMQAVQDAMSKITQQKINATIKLMPISWSSWAQQTTLMIAGNEKIDVIFSSNYFNYDSVVAKGELLPMEDQIEKYGQDIKTVLGTDYLNCSKINGHIYAVPSTRDFAANFGVVMRKDMVDKYKIDVSSLKTYSDLTAVFKTIKDNELGVTPLDKGSDITTIVEQILSSKYDRLDNWFGVIPMNSTDMKVVDLYETQDYADAVNLARSWFVAGYISKDAATSKEQGQDVIKAGKAFSMLVPMKPGYDLQESTLCATPMVSASFSQPITNTSNVANVMESISKTTGDADRSVMFLNLLYSDKDLVNLFDNGIENLDYVKTDTDNVIDFPSGITAANTGYTSCNWMAGNNYLSYVWKGDDPSLWTEMKKFNDSSLKSPALGFSFNVDPVKTEIAAVTNVENQYQLGLETGTLDPATTLPEFISKLKAAGIDKIIAEKQSQLDKWAAAR